MEVIIRAQYFKQSSLSPVWRLYLPVLYVTMLKLHGAECIHDEVVWLWHCVCYLDGWLMLVWELVHVLYHHSCGLWGSVQKFVSESYGRSGDVRLYCCVIYGWVWGQSIMLLCHRWCVCFSSLHSFMALSHYFLYHRVRRFLFICVLNLKRCRVVSSHYSLKSSSSKHCTRQL